MEVTARIGKCILNETLNNGRTVHLYYSQTYKLYVAYGLSAYIINKVIKDAETSYDGDVQMPMVKVDDSQVEILKEKMKCTILKERTYLRLETTTNFYDHYYSTWANYLREL